MFSDDTERLRSSLQAMVFNASWASDRVDRICGRACGERGGSGGGTRGVVGTIVGTDVAEALGEGGGTRHGLPPNCSFDVTELSCVGASGIDGDSGPAGPEPDPGLDPVEVLKSRYIEDLPSNGFIAGGWAT